ncbi:MAG: hypothetical protein JWM21_2985 [Acidobacteria bacterium]|nr:hypothetical protein [Acidobacteriota bacterium]
MLARANSRRPKTAGWYHAAMKILVVALSQVMRYHAIS